MIGIGIWTGWLARQTKVDPSIGNRMIEWNTILKSITFGFFSFKHIIAAALSKVLEN